MVALSRLRGQEQGRSCLTPRVGVSVHPMRSHRTDTDCPSDREMENEERKEINHDRERLWNAPANSLQRKRSSLLTTPPSERIRTLSTPARPSLSPRFGPGLSPSPTHHSQPNHRSHGSYSSMSSRSSRSSLSGSQANADLGKEREEEEVEEVEQERERNWNSPHPSWTKRHSYHTPARPASPALSTSSIASRGGAKPSAGARTVRVRAESMKEKASVGTGSGTVRVSPRAKQPAATVAKTTKPSPRGSHAASKTASSAPARQADSSTDERNELSSSVIRISPAKHNTAEKPVPIPVPAARPKTPQPSEMQESETDAREDQNHSGVWGDSDFNSGLAINGRGGWMFPRPQSPLPAVQLESASDAELSPPPSPSRTRRPITPTLNGHPKPSQIPVRSPKKGPSELEVSPQKGHKRATTEFATSVGRLPPSVNPKISPLFDAAVELTVPSAEESDAGSSPRQVTPKLLPVATPPPSETLATPPISPERQSFSSPSQDEERLRKVLGGPAVPKPETPPALPPAVEPEHPSPSVLATPPRASTSTPRIAFETPSPPKGMPDLPEPPSEDDTVELPLRTPLRFNGFNDHANIIAGDFSSMKTPRPPGAWAATPLPARQDEPEKRPAAPLLSRAQSLPADSSDESASGTTGLVTPAPTLSRASSLPQQTPAPPGGWLATPYTANRKSVRFDVESPDPSVAGDVTESEVPTEPTSPAVEPAERPSVEISHLELKLIDRVVNGRATLTPSPDREHKDEGDVTPRMANAVLPSAPSNGHQWSPKRFPAVRVLDAYGREHAPEGDFAEGALGSSPIAESTVVERTPRNKSGVRMLDAMGREIEEGSVEDGSLVSQSEDEGPLSHNDAVARLRAGVADLRADMSDADRYADVLGVMSGADGGAL
jgi:serine/arginine repetitive matrix protein 2